MSSCWVGWTTLVSTTLPESHSFVWFSAALFLAQKRKTVSCLLNIFSSSMSKLIITYFFITFFSYIQFFLFALDDPKNGQLDATRISARLAGGGRSTKRGRQPSGVWCLRGEGALGLCECGLSWVWGGFHVVFSGFDVLLMWFRWSYDVLWWSSINKPMLKLAPSVWNRTIGLVIPKVGSPSTKGGHIPIRTNPSEP